MKTEENAEKLVSGILEAARREGAAAISAAEAEAAAILASARAGAERAGRARLETALAEAERRRRMLMAAVPVEAGRIAAARLESLLASIKEEALSRLRGETGSRAGTTAALAAEAVKQMEGNSFILTISSADKAALPGLEEEIERLAAKGKIGIFFKEDPGLDGGAIALSADGRQYCDNSLSGRLERFWPELRRQLGRELETGGGTHGL